MARATFAEILVAPEFGRDGRHPCVPFGQLQVEPHVVAVGHSETEENGRLRVPRDMILKLHPRLAAHDPWLEPRTGYQVRLAESNDAQPLEEVLHALLVHESAGLHLKGVHRVENTNGAVVLPLLPHQVRQRRPEDPAPERCFTHRYRPLALHPQLDYLARHPGARLAHYPRVTSSCREKLELLEEVGEPWSIERIISAHFFTRPEQPARYTVLVGPELRELGGGSPVQRERVASELAGYPVRYARRGELPAEMESGTCTPFVFRSRAPDLERVILLQGRPEHRHLPEEFSVGAHGPEAHAAGLQLTPATTEAILREELGLPLLVKPRY